MAQDVYPTAKLATLQTVYEVWSAATAYVIDDRVSETVGSVTSYYRCILGHTNQNPPNGTYWAVETPSGFCPFTSYTKHAKNWDDVTIVSEFEDKAVDVNESADDVPQRWTFVYTDKSQARRKIIMDFWNAHRRAIAFTLVEPRDDPWTATSGMGNPGSVVEDVFFEALEDGGHAESSYKRNNFTVKLIKYPA